MAFITREDGEHFVVPSYRDILSAKKKSLLKDEILTLCQNYGNYITLQKKNVDQYEAAFSPDPGYLLGETAWYHFKRPQDMVYCELLPNKTEALLVVVKSGSVYLDGSFPVDSIPEELIIFLTQKNNFDIYIYGDVPISQTPTSGKFSFDAPHIKSFTVLNEPAFQSFPRVKTFLLQPVDRVLAANPNIHYETTAEEILIDIPENLAMVVAGVGTGGTITGIARKIKEQRKDVKIIGVDPLGSILGGGTEVFPYLVEGIGYDFCPKVLDNHLIDDYIKVNDQDSFMMARRLIKEEGLLVGGSAGSAVWAALQAAKHLKKGQKCVVILPDSIRNYLRKFVDDEWLKEKGLDINEK